MTVGQVVEREKLARTGEEDTCPLMECVLNISHPYVSLLTARVVWLRFWRGKKTQSSKDQPPPLVAM